MISCSFEKIDRSHIEALVANNVSERRDLEFKRDLPGTKPDDVQEFLADVTSLANAQGGDLIYGVEANKDGIAVGVPGVAIPSADKALQRLENLLRDSVDPRLNGVRMEWIPIDVSAGVIVIRVPSSLAAPHRVRVGKGGLLSSTSKRPSFSLRADPARHANCPQSG